MSASARWADLYNQTPLCDVPRHYAGLNGAPFLLEYLTEVLRRCPPGGRTLETGVGSGYGAVWLSERGLRAEGIDYAPALVERARLVNNVLGGRASFRVGDLFDLYPDPHSAARGRYDVIHHQGVLEHFPAPQIRAALAQQVALADWVVFSVPSVFYPFAPEFGDERLLPLEEWARVLAPFDVAGLRYYGDPRLGGKEHVLGVLRGAPAAPALRALMRPGAEPYPAGVSAVVHTRNEARHIAACLETLTGWADETIVCDMESEDATVEIARRYTDNIVRHPRIPNFDRARNVSAMRAACRWVFYLDADERVPPGLGPALRALIDGPDPPFAALLIPFRHHFAGRWMRCLYPGYTAPRLLRNGRFHFNPRLHSGAQVDGPVLSFPPDDPGLALEHFSFDSLAHYLEKLNRYTDGEAADMHRDGRPFHWQDAVAHFVADFQAYYDRGGAPQDGVHGFLYSFLSAFYRFEQHAKLYERRFRGGQLQPPEEQVPAGAEEVLEFALAAARRRPRPAPTEVRLAAGGAPVVWSGPLLDPSGYGDEVRQLVLALEETGAAGGEETREAGGETGAAGGPGGAQGEEAAGGDGAAGGPVAAQVTPWGEREAPLGAGERRRLEALTRRAAAPGFVQVVHNFAPLFRRDPRARAAVGRTMFETDRLPADWVRACNAMDAVWVPGEFNRGTFARAGVAEDKLMVVPGCLDPGPFRDAPARGAARAGLPASVQEALAGDAFVFLAVFDWTLHKGWDVLLRAFLEEFAGEGRAGEPDVRLLLRVWSSLGLGADGIRAQAAACVREALGADVAARELSARGRVWFAFEHLDPEGLVALYGASGAYVLPSRGEGWGRPYLEAMASGLPVIGTGWGGSTAFMTPETSLLVDYDLADVPERGWREVPAYRGHRWAEPRAAHLRALMRRVVADREEAGRLGERARRHVAAHFSRAAVGPLVAAAAAQVRARHTPHPVMAPAAPGAGASQAPGATGPPHVSPPDAVPIRVRWEGAQLRWHSLAHVNRELCLGLLDPALVGPPGVELSVCPTEAPEFGPDGDPRLARLAARAFAPLSGPADVHVRHGFPPRLGPADEGRLVLVQPWEYGYLPREWVPQIAAHVAEVWCYSRYVREVYRASGVAEARLRLLPLGVDASVFRPDAPPYVFTTEAGAAETPEGLRGRFVFLYVGGTIHRKGADVLLEAYRRAFGPADAVALVVKDTGTRTVYRDQNEAARIREMIADPAMPRVVYLDEELPAHRLAGVYAAADCLVAPYRGEGFCLPALEAMACGTPVIVPAGGPTDDFVDEAVGWRVAAARRPCPEGRVGPWECVGLPWMFEVDPDDLAGLLREVRQDPGLARRKGEAAARRVASGWTWGHSAAAAAGLLGDLRSRAVPGWTGLAPTGAEPEGGRAARGEGPPGRERPGPPPAEAPPRPVTAPPLPALPVQWRPPAAVRAGEDTRLEPARRHGGPTISLCMIVRDEERVLGDCLRSVCPWVDEVVVVDTGSTDRTPEIARAHGARVESFAWCDDFSAARNASLAHATGDWIFWMDADDTLPEDCGRRLHDLALRAPERTAGLIVQVQIPPGPGEAGCTVVDHVKLFRNGLGLRFEGRIHEQILEPIYRAGSQVERTDLYVVHSGYDHSPEGQRRKRARDLRLLELDLRDRPDHPFVLFNIGMTAFHMKEYDRARAALERCLALSRPQESTVRKVYAMLAGCLQGQGDVAGAVARAEQGLALYPRDPELLFRAGVLHHQAGDLAAAEASYLRLLTDREVGHIDSLDVSMTGFKAHHNLALVYQDMGRWAEAEAQWRAAVGQEPGFGPSWAGLAELCRRQGRLAEFEAAAERAALLDPALAQRLRPRAGGPDPGGQA
ncbi:MAG: glycosyltransferase [Armatimonadetes bacterium]|nr:glycosyltransferase [Armatimonadota bacterium]